ncbi:cyclic lactone autoinducer peptide [Clostridium sp. HMP27]|nr:cyclic lactone autoinducer peptide [Clostridium sp. HMP27]KGK87761.1 cyclic lactone autoinducer peptide [Clostridium sp. HMP27]
MKKLNSKFLALIATLTTIVAASVATSACSWFSYQPEEPKCLRDE